MAELADKNPDVVGLCADLIGSLKFEKFIEKAPERFFQVGIAEAKAQTGRTGRQQAQACHFLDQKGMLIKFFMLDSI